MHCIICKKPKPHDEFTTEHIFPESIGGDITLNCVCKDCNSSLGHSVDSNLLSHVFVDFERFILRIPGKSGKIPNPIAKGYINDGQDEIQCIFDKFGVFKELKTFPKIKTSFGDNGTLEIQVKADAKEKANLKAIFNKILKRSGLDKLSEEEIQNIENTQPLPGEQPLISKTFVIDLFSYKLAIIKIAYELGYHCLGNTYFNDNMGESLRLSILDNSLEENWLRKHSIDAKIGLVEGEISLFPHFTNEKDHHIALIERSDSDNKLICRIKIFNAFQGVITISKSLHLYPNFVSKFIAINAQTQKSRESDLEIELLKIAGAIPRQS